MADPDVELGLAARLADVVGPFHCSRARPAVGVEEFELDEDRRLPAGGMMRDVSIFWTTCSCPLSNCWRLGKELLRRLSVAKHCSRNKWLKLPACEATFSRKLES